MNTKGNIRTFLGCDNTYEESDIVIFGAPFDSTTSYRPGTRFAPDHMRSQSFGFETYSPYQDKDVLDVKVYDAGDEELPFGDPKAALEMIEKNTKKIINDGKTPLMIGGEHLVSLGSVKAMYQKYPDLHVLHFDAHSDLRDEYLGQKLSHATVMRRIWEFLGDERIYQFGIRSGDREEFLWGKDHVSTVKFGFTGFEDTLKKLKGKPVYFSLDLDILDPSCFPGTGTPEAGGIFFDELREKMTRALNFLDIKGMDINELSPNYDISGISTAAACKLLREMILGVSKKGEKTEF